MLNIDVEQVFDTLVVTGGTDMETIELPVATGVPTPRGADGPVEVAFTKGAEPVVIRRRDDPDDDSKPWTRRAHPDSPVGRTIRELAEDPGCRHPLRMLEARLGRPLLDLTCVTNAELNELAGLVLAEKIRRDQRWT